MGGLFGGGKKQSNSQQAPSALSLRVQTSAYGMTRPILLGRNRLTGNLLWYGDFLATAHTESSGGGGGKGGGGGGGTTTTSYTYSVYAQYGLCEGTIQEIRKIYREKGFESFSGSETGLGSPTQAPWNYVASAHPEESINYSGTAWWAKGLDLGDNANMPNFSFDVIGGLAENTAIVDTTFTASGNKISVPSPQLPLRAGEAVTIYSATNGLAGEYWLIPTSTANVWQLSNNPDSNAITFGNDSGHIKTINHNASAKNVFVNLLTNSGYGAQFPASMLDTTLTQFDAYTKAAGIFLSPLIDSSDTAQSIIQKLADICNSQPLWSNGKLTMIPYGDSTITGNGTTYTPNVTPIYDLNDDDFIVSSMGDDPVKVTIRNQNDTFNTVQVEFLNATNQYNAEPVEVQDLANIEAAKQIRADSAQSYHWITEPRTAMTVAQNRLQRGLYIRAQYEFQLGWKYCLLEPMDIVTITDEALGLQLYPVRILEINEDETGLLSVTAEEFPAGIGHAALYPHQDSVGNRPSHTIDAGNINAPIIFDAPVELTNGDYQVWMGVSGSFPSWGGCQIWMSNDGINYAQVAMFRNKSRMGVLSANMPANYAATDTTSTLSINTFESGAEILSVTDADLNALTSLIYVDGEFMAYRDATLTGANAYDLKKFKRGLYNSNIGAHANDSNFLRCDDQLVKISLPIDQIGKTKYIKFLSFTVYGDDIQDLSQVPYYTYTPTGQTQPPVELVTASARAKSFLLNWKNPTNFDFDRVEVWLSDTNDRATATKYGEVRGTMATVGAEPGNYYVWLKAIGKSGKASAWEPVLSTGGVLAVSNPDSLIGNLTNESVVLSADSSGNVSSFASASGQFVVYQGNQDVTLSCTFAKTSNTGCTAAINSTGNYSVSAMSADSATAVFTATYNGVTITKILSLAKAKAGTSGTNGADAPYWLTQYAVTTSITTEPASGWQSTMPTVPVSYYLWQRQGIVQPPATVPTVWGAGARLTGVRGSKQFYLPNYTSWATPPAATFPDGAPVLNDIVTEYGSSGFSETRFWDGSAWAVVTQVINGNLLVNGSIGATKIGVTDLSAISANLGTITGGSLNINNQFTVAPDGTCSIKNGAGQVIFSSGGAVWDYVTGANKPANNATVGATWDSNVINQPSNDLIYNNLQTGTWVGGQTPPWALNGLSTESVIEYDTDVNGVKVPVWKCISDGDGGADGGWNPYGENWFKVDKSKPYRFAVPVKRTGGKTGSYFWGILGNSVCDLNTTNKNTNPYFAYANRVGLVENRWYLLVGYVFPAGSTGNTNAGSGIFDLVTGELVAERWNYCWANDVDYIGTRAYQFYCVSAGETQVFGYPTVEVVDGTESKLFSNLGYAALLNREQKWVDVSGTGKPADYADVTNYSDTRVSNVIEENNTLLVSRPVGASFNNNQNAVTGMIRIILPQGFTDTMMKFTVNVYTYDSEKSFSLHLAGFNFRSSTWFNTEANLIGSTAADNRVRFGYDSTLGKCCIYIGEPTSSWSYPKVMVKDFIAGYSSFARSLWETGWAIDIVTSAPQNVTVDYTDALIDAASIKNQGAFATLNKITPSNVTTYIDNVAIGTAQIGDAAVQTLKIANQAVTVPISSSNLTIRSISNSGLGSLALAVMPVIDSSKHEAYRLIIVASCNYRFINFYAGNSYFWDYGIAVNGSYVMSGRAGLVFERGAGTFCITWSLDAYTDTAYSVSLNLTGYAVADATSYTNNHTISLLSARR